MHIHYLSNSRFPSERAHTTQIVAMCQTFAAAGATVKLWVTDRTTDITESPDSYYGVDFAFSVERLSVPDIARQALKIPKVFHGVAFTIQRICFVVAAMKNLRTKSINIVYGRDEWILWLLSFFRSKQSIVFESHEAKWNLPARRLLKQGIRCVVISEGIRDFYLAKGVSAGQLLVAHDGIDESFLHTTHTKPEARASLGIDPQKPAVFYIGGLDAWKGVDTFFKAVTDLSEIEAYVIGGTKIAIQQYEKQYPHVTFLGPRPYRDLPLNQQAADILVIPNTATNELSNSYTSPLKLFAHMASGVPMVASAIPSIQAVLSNTMATFAAADDEVALKNAIKDVIADFEAAKGKAKVAQEAAGQYVWSARAHAIMQFMQSK